MVSFLAQDCYHPRVSFDEPTLPDLRIAGSHADGGAQLICVRGGCPTMTLSGTVLRIGRSNDGNDLVLGSEHVSRWHVRLELRGRGWYIEDLDSKNGTYLRGRRLTSGEANRLRHQDLIRVWDYDFLFVDWAEYARSRNLPQIRVDSVEAKAEAERMIKEFLGTHPGRAAEPTDPADSPKPSAQGGADETGDDLAGD